MRFGWIECGSAAAIVASALLAVSPSKAADQTGVRTAAEELGSRTVAAPADAPKDKLSDSAVRVMSTFALSILPDEIPNPHEKGGMIKLDKSNPNLYLIPIDDARHVFRVATRSAYAEVCNLLELEKANYDTLMRIEQLRNVWTDQQMMFIRALHTFATSYFAGNVKITEQPADAPAGAKAKDGTAAADAANGASNVITSKKLECSDAQRQKVAQAITAYVQTGPTTPPPAAAAAPQAAPAAPAPAPVAGGAN
jgi:hypothetical protein